jgi:hypothetical protein
MQDPKFEQEVQRRMHDLEFVPSESVWAGIRQGIGPRKRRRAVAVLWWLIPGMLLLTGGIVMYRHSASTAGVAAVVPAAGIGKPGGRAGKGSGTGISAETGTRGVGIAGSRAVDAGNRNDGAVTDVKAAGGEGGAAAGGEGGTAAGREGGTAAGREGGAAAGVEREAAAVRIASWQRHQPGLIGGMASRRGVMAPPPDWKPVNTAVSGIRQPRHPWMAGFAAGGGAALIHTATGNPLTYSSPTYSALAFGGGNQYGSSLPAAGGSKQIVNDVKAGYSYWAGIYGEKQLSARWSVDIGLNLHYYSVRFETNNEIPLYTPSSSSLFVSTPYTYAMTPSVASSRAGAQTSYSSYYYSYYNRYYFLEVPATVQYRLNHSRTLPLFWRGGAVFSWLMSSNGLYYDNSTGSYEKGNGLVRRAQAGVNSGLMVGLPIRGVQIQAGPEVQYALTSMLTAAPGGGHMVYGGMRVALMR